MEQYSSQCEKKNTKPRILIKRIKLYLGCFLKVQFGLEIIFLELSEISTIPKSPDRQKHLQFFFPF